MRFLIVAFVAAVTVSATPQNSVSSVTSTPSSSIAASTSSSSSTNSQPVTHTIAVAKGGHTFVPDTVQADQGDYIEFQFYPTNHSVVRAAYGYPCVPYEMVEPDQPGFFSGFHPVDSVLSNPPTWTIRINDTEPIFFYCSQLNSCIGYEMVGAINPNTTMTLQQQKDLAGQSQFMLSPGQPWPSEGSIPSGIATASSTPAATGGSISSQSASSSTASTTAAPAASHHHGIDTGTIAGVAVGAAAVLLIGGFAIFWCGRQSRRTKQLTREHQRQQQLQQKQQQQSMQQLQQLQQLQQQHHMSTHSSPRDYEPVSPMTALFSPIATQFAQAHIQPKHPSEVSTYAVQIGHGGAVVMPQSPPPTMTSYPPQQQYQNQPDPVFASRELNVLHGNNPDTVTQPYPQAAPAYVPQNAGNGNMNLYSSPAPPAPTPAAIPPSPPPQPTANISTYQHLPSPPPTATHFPLPLSHPSSLQTHIQIHEMPGAGQMDSPLEYPRPEMRHPAQSQGWSSISDIHPAKRDLAMVQMQQERDRDAGAGGSGRRRSIEKFEYRQ